MKMDEHSALGWVIVAVAGVVGISVLTNAQKGGGGVFSGLGGLIFGEDAITGKWGENAGKVVFNGIVPGTQNNPAYPNPNSPTGSGQTFGNAVFGGGVKLNVTATDSAFGKLGLNTSQMNQINARYGFDVGNAIVRKIASGNSASLTSRELDALHSVGWTG
jgi:hypothetical protein